MCGGSLLLQVQSHAGDEEPHSGVDEEWQTQNPRLLLGMQYQDVQVGEGLAGKKKAPDFSKAFIYHNTCPIGEIQVSRLDLSGSMPHPAKAYSSVGSSHSSIITIGPTSSIPTSY
jgi:hypothetical protein